LWKQTILFGDPLAIIKEDKIICEQIEINLDSGIYKPGYLLSTKEDRVQVIQSQLRSELKSTHLQLE
jgi:hypothetical protein